MASRFLVLALLSFLVTACGSLVNEASRLQQLYDQKNGGSLTVIATDPADNSTAPYNQTYVDVTFSAPIDPATFTAQALFGACAGSFQLSYDLFGNCLSGTVDTSANPRIRFTPTIFPKALGLQIRITSAVIGATGIPATPYTSSVGFKLGAPCGNSNCFFSYSTPLTHAASTLSGIFRIQSGIHSGKYLIYSASGSATTLIDPQAGLSEVGPPLCFVPTNGSTDFYIATGTNAGKQLVLRGAGTTNTCFYDPLSGGFTTTGAPGLPGGLGANNGAFSVQPGAGFDTDNTLIFRGGGVQMLRYTAVGGTIADTLEVAAANISDRAHAVRLTTGTDIGKFLVFIGSGFNQTNLLNPAAGSTTLAASGTTSVNLGAGALSFEVTSGLIPNRVITMVGGSATSSVFSTTALGVTGNAGPSLATGTLGAGSLLLKQPGNISDTRPLIINGGGIAAHATNYFDADNNLFVAGPMTTGAIGAGSAAAWVPSAQGVGGGFIIVNGGTGYSTSVYLPNTNMFHGSRMPTSVPNLGANAFRVTAGTNSGRTIIVGGNATNETAIFDPITYQMFRGKPLTGTANSNAMNMPITRGANAGYVVVFHGGGAFSVYNPNSATFDTSAGFPITSSIGTGGQAFAVENSPNIIIVRGGDSNADKYDQVANTMGATIPVGAAVSGDPVAIKFVQPSTGNAKTMIFANSTTMRIFDHVTESFSASFSLAPSGGPGLKGFAIPSGTHVGKVLILHGGGSSGISMMNNETGLSDPSLPSTGSCVPSLGSGSQILPLVYGPNTGKVLVLFGGTTRSSCIYNPATHSFSPGPDVGNVASVGFQLTAGSVAFPTGGGVYPTSFIVISGALKNVWSTYVP
jgi:hypothetical protein